MVYVVEREHRGRNLDPENHRQGFITKLRVGNLDQLGRARYGNANGKTGAIKARRNW
jgi:hypothetical protein